MKPHDFSIKWCQECQIGAHQKAQKILKNSRFYGMLKHRGETTFPVLRKGVHEWAKT